MGHASSNMITAHTYDSDLDRVAHWLGWLDFDC